MPGWLNVDGLPTSCVGDLPMLEPHVPLSNNPTPAFTPPTLPDVLAYTGPGDDLLSWLIVAASVLILGGLVVGAFRWMGGDE